MQLNNHTANLDAAHRDWFELMRTYNLPHEDSEWANEMRRQHDDYFAQAPNLDFDLRELIVLYRNALRPIDEDADSMASSPELGMGLRPTLSVPLRQAQRTSVPANAGDDTAPTSTNASNGTTSDPSSGTPDPTGLVGEEDPRETLARRNADAPSTATPPAQQNATRRVRIRDTPTEIAPLEDLTLRSEAGDDSDQEFYEAPAARPLRPKRTWLAADAEHMETPTPQHSDRQKPSTHRRRTSHRDNSSTHGLFAHTDGLVTNATPMALQNTRTGNGQHHETSLYVASPAQANVRNEAYRRSPLYLASLSAANAAPEDRMAYLASGTAGADNRSHRASTSRDPSPRRAVDPATRAVHRERLQHVLQGARPLAAGRGRSEAPAFASATAAPDGRTAHRSPSPTFDTGADFGRENASKFYRNAVYSRTPSTTIQPLVLNTLSIPKFSGDIRAFPMFRNRFLERVEPRKDLTPSQKFLYLLQHLADEPLREATEYIITDDNYFTVLDYLEERYGNKGQLIDTLNQALINLRPPGQNAVDLRSFHNQARRLVDEMRHAGEEVEGNSMWKKTLYSKLTPSLRLKIFESLGEDPKNVPIDAFLACLLKSIRLLEASDNTYSWKALVSTAGNSGRSGLPCRPDPRSTAHRAGTYATDADATYVANTRMRILAYDGYNSWDSATSASEVAIGLDMPQKTDDACKICNNGLHHRALSKESLRQQRMPFASARHSPVRATSPGLRVILKNEQGSSSKQESRGTTPVTRAGVQVHPTAKTVRLPSAQDSSTRGEGISKKHGRKKSKGSRTDPKGRDGTTRPTTAAAHENVTQMDANACSDAGLLPEHQGI